MKRLLLAAILSSTAPAFAGDVNFSVLIKNEEGAVMKDCAKIDDTDRTKCANERDVTLRLIALAALNVPDATQPADEQIRRGLLAQTIYKGVGPIALDAKDTELLKTLIAKRGYPPLVVLQAFQQLDPASVKK